VDKPTRNVYHKLFPHRVFSTSSAHIIFSGKTTLEVVVRESVGFCTTTTSNPIHSILRLIACCLSTSKANCLVFARTASELFCSSRANDLKQLERRLFAGGLAAYIIRLFAKRSLTPRRAIGDSSQQQSGEDRGYIC